MSSQCARLGEVFNRTENGAGREGGGRKRYSKIERRPDRNSVVYALTRSGGGGRGSWVGVEGGAGVDQIWKTVG